MIDQDRNGQDNDEAEDLGGSDVQQAQDEAGIAGEPQPATSGDDDQPEEPAAHPS